MEQREPTDGEDPRLIDALPFPVSVWQAVRDESNAIVDFVCTGSNRLADERIGLIVAGRTTLIGLTYVDYFTGEEGLLGWDHFRRVVEERVVDLVEAPAPGWENRWFESLSAPYRDGFVNVMRDISRRRLAQGALETSEQRFRGTMEALTDAVFLADPVRDADGEAIDFVFTYANEAASRMLGRPRDEIEGARYLSLWPHRITGAIDVLMDVAREGRAAQLDVPWVEAGPLRGSYELNILPLDDGLVVVAHDVTGRVVAEQHARENERLFRLMADHAGDVIVAAKHGVVQWAAPSIERLMGWSVDEVIGREAIDFVHPDAREVVENAVFSPSVTTRYRVQLLRKDGEWQWVDLLARVAGPEADPAHPLVITVIDAQAEMEARDALQRAEQERRFLDERVRESVRLESLSQLAGGVAHDFNNLLVGILGNAELALQDLPSSSPIRSRLVAMSAAAQRAAELTRQLLDFTGRQPRERVALDLAPLIADTLDLARSMLPREVAIGFTADGRAAGVLGDRSQLQQVVMNLVMNAGDAVDQHTGKVAVSLREVVVDDADRSGAESTVSESTDSGPTSGLPPGRYAVFEVTDNGRGIAPDDQHRIFDPFFTTRSDGRGLGLAVVSGIVRAHHGSVRVHSQPGQGTVFTVVLPAIDLPDTVLSSTTNFRLHRQPTVLVVDDDDQVRDVVGDILRRAGFQVLSVARGREAISLFASRHANIDCVVLDLTMPDLSGDEVMVVLRAVEPNVPIVLISGYLSNDPVREAAAMKATDFVQKPFLPGDLVDAVRRSLHQTPFQSPFDDDRFDAGLDDTDLDDTDLDDAGLESGPRGG